MRVGIIQSSYIPWRGYFDFIASVDRFIVYDDVQYSTGSWRNRNQLKLANGLKWITVPVKSKLGLAIDEVEIEHAHPWQEQHRGMLKAALGKAPHYDEVSALWEKAIRANDRLISDLNLRLTEAICGFLGIATPIERSRKYGAMGAGTERLIGLLRAVGATTYLSGPTAKGYLDESMFRTHGIRLEYKSYSYPDYPQQFDGFAGTVSALDLIANTGLDAIRYLRSTTPDEVAVE